MDRRTRRKLNENVQEGDRDEEQVHRAPENRIETPEVNRNHEQVQRHPESHMQVTRGRNSCRQVPRGATNHLQAQRSVGRNRDPSSQLWQWNQIYPRDDFRPKNINSLVMKRFWRGFLEMLPAEDYFKLYIDDKMIDYIVTQTNLYVAQYLEKEQGNLRPHSLVHDWKPTDRAEMLTLLAVLILMGIIH